ncbi:MAG: DUF763 domain-containing protein [Armatimonadota bacterium]|nr:DUF763 domain-containing protein [Armatimonadota bacterium]MDR7426876.1 DUF763 domain-containing protein [Armatimonadota bacterium]MDR7465354.1 DUF763 domain-containing protein [Armatimonadota bacterium]MDR7468823.1 DUF763 domain-containing protein [Armatimonadota bacterium]MDR7473656.1 DUF763 domain-containing protein [Armatimonadota bacterium]
MRRTGTATLPLHGGRAPRWLFARMVRLARAVVEALVEDAGPAGVLRRLADPFWFQAFGCLLGFDWHSSGVTTTVCGALKEGLKGTEGTLGLLVAGGKGAASRHTPWELSAYGERFGLDPAPLVYASRLAAKVDNNALQDGYQLYHHTFFLTREGAWGVVQQGMRPADRTARRYHWLGEAVQSFVCEPHAAICCDHTGPVLNLVAAESAAARSAITTLASEPPQRLLAELARIRSPAAELPTPDLRLPVHHAVEWTDIHPERLAGALLRTYQAQASTFEALLGLPGVGARTLRALALLSEVLAGAPPSWRDPARFAFAHGGKDGHPFPVDRTTYDRTIALLEDAVRRARLGEPERLGAIRRLHTLGAA